MHGETLKFSKHSNLVFLFLPILQPQSRDHRHCRHPFQEKRLRHIAQSILTIRTTTISPAASSCFTSIPALISSIKEVKIKLSWRYTVVWMYGYVS